VAGTPAAPPADAAATKQPAVVSDAAAGLEQLLLTGFGAGATAAEFDAVAAQALALMGAQDSGGRAPGDTEFMRPVKKTNDWGEEMLEPAELVLGVPEALDGAIAAGLLGRLTDTTGLPGKPSPFMRWWVKGAVGSTAHLLASALLAHAGREEVAEVCGPSNKVMIAQLGAELERLLLTDFGAGATAAELDAVAAQALALMGAKDSGGRAPGDAEFMRPVKINAKGILVPAELVLGVAEALDGAIAAGLLTRLTGGSFRRWSRGAARSGANTGEPGDAGEATVASAGDAAATAARVVLVTALLARATRCEAPEKKAMLHQLYGARLQRAHLHQAQLQGAQLPQARLQGANLREGQFQKADLRIAQLQGADLQQAQLQGAHLENAQLQGAKLEDAQLQKTNLPGANLVGVEAARADFTGARLQYACVGAEPDKDTNVTNFNEVCARAPYIRTLRSYHFATLMCDGVARLRL
jgi:uncharacterized protein YjbI with pentapeptide repeats